MQLLAKNEIIDIGIFVFCVLITVIMYFNKQIFLTVAFIIVSILYLFFSVIKFMVKREVKKELGKK